MASATANIAGAVATPFTQSNVPLNNLASEVSYTVDFSTLPLRPTLIVEAAPDAAHADMELELEVTNCDLDYPNEFKRCDQDPTFGVPRLSDRNTGAQSVDFQPWKCGGLEINSPPYVGKSCQVKVRALDFGTSGAPATFDITIRGETSVPTSTVSSEITSTLQSASIPAAKDTTLYQSSTGASNGQGESFWTSTATASNALHSLMAFDVQANVPAGATIVDAQLELSVLATAGTPAFQVYAVPRNPSVAWVEGNANAAGDESTPPTALNNAATWSHRQWFSAGALGPWSTAGGDRDPTSLRNVTVTQTGLLVVSGNNLLQHVRTLHTNTTTYDGMLLFPLSGGIRFASAENTTAALRPRLVVQYYLPTTLEGVDIPTTTSEFFNEGQDFRWIYDLDEDNVLITPVLGRCEWSPPGGFLIFMPYTYQYQGNPAYHGLDCCTWQIGSRTGVTGTGQAIFYINTDSSLPANQPGDLDLDGIKDLCDNCQTVPNGPLLGTCTSGPSTGSTCLSNQQCGDFPCSLAQDDDDLNGSGNACVPEPGLGAMLASGLVALAALERRRRSR
jgi:hypothetical protein